MKKLYKRYMTMQLGFEEGYARYPSDFVQVVVGRGNLLQIGIVLYP